MPNQKAFKPEGSFKAVCVRVCPLQQGYTAFEPHFMHQKCEFPTNSTSCQDNCIHNGRYCAFDSILGKYTKQYKPRQVRVQCLESV